MKTEQFNTIIEEQPYSEIITRKTFEPICENKMSEETKKALELREED